MKKLIFLFAFIFVASLGYSQLKVVAPGDVGIGTGTPLAKLHVYADNYCGLFVQSLNSSAQLRLRGPNQAIVFDNELGAQQGIMQVDIPTQQFIWNNNLNGRFFWLTNDKKMVFTADGRLGVNNTIPSQTLDVSGSAFKNDGSTAWLTVSDRRLKKDVVEYADGLEQVLQINPVSFTYNGQGGTIDGQVAVGIIAQEMQEIAPYMIGEITLADREETIFGEFDVPSEKQINQKTYLSYDANALPYMLVNAIKDQQDIIDNQEAQIEELENKMNQILESLAQGTINSSATNNNNQLVELYGEKGGLQQNTPNPFNEVTVISYFIPERASNSYVQIFDLDGSILKTVSLNEKGAGQLTIKANELAPGSYMYNLVIDGQLIDTKKMVLTK